MIEVLSGDFDDKFLSFQKLPENALPILHRLSLTFYLIICPIFYIENSVKP